MAHVRDGEEPPPFSLHGGLLSTLRDESKQNREKDIAVSERLDAEQNGNVVSTHKTAIDNENKENQTESTMDVALLLTSVAEIASMEVPSSPQSLSMEGADLKSCGSRPRAPSSVSDLSLGNQQGDCIETEAGEQLLPRDVVRNRARAVSYDAAMPRQYFNAESDSSPFEEGLGNGVDPSRPYSPNEYLSSTLMTPPHSPHCAARRPRSISTSSADFSPTTAAFTTKAPLQPCLDLTTSGAPKTILRKKFSWKNYPELEAFLIANREEYLRHSTLNYTVQQKQYNNRLTERMLELASENGYVFDDHDFSFVTVRDRIRCYYKSYVQSLKKRGVIIGYAARKAGLVTEDELEKSAAVAGLIYTPPTAHTP